MVSNCLTQKDNLDMLKALRVNHVSSDNLKLPFFKSERLIFELLKKFIVEIQFHLENKALFMSAYYSGKVIVSVCSNIEFFVTDSHVSSVVSKRLRSFLTDICRTVNMSHKMYKFKESEELKLQLAIVKSLGDIRLLVAEVLFAMIEADS